MNKKIFVIFFIAALLLVSAGAVSAADSQGDSKAITVKIKWDDAAKVSERPNQVSVKLIKDGNVVDTAVLKASNSWKATFNAQGDGTYKVTASDLNDYSINIGGSAGSGFVVTYTLKADVLGASDDDAVIEQTDDAVVAEDANNDAVGNNDVRDDALAVNETADDDQANETNTTEDANSTEEKTDDTNTTDDEADETDTTDDEADDETADDAAAGSAPAKTSDKNPVTKEKIKKLHKPLKKNKVSKAKLRNTGIPLAILVVAAIGSIFVPFSRRK